MLRDEELCGKQPLYMEETLKVFAANQGLDKNFPSMVCRVLNLRKNLQGLTYGRLIQRSDWASLDIAPVALGLKLEARAIFISPLETVYFGFVILD
jgi:hypothetical protein